MKRARPLPAFGAAFALVTLAALAFAPPALAAGPDPAAETQRLLTSLDTPAARPVVQDPVTKAKAAQQRAMSARGAGDLLHGTELDALALAWAQVADDLLKTAGAEKQLADVQKAVADLEQKAVRTQALIEQTIARRGRAEQNLNSLPATQGAKSGREPKAAAAPAAANPAALPPAAKAKPAVKP